MAITPNAQSPGMEAAGTSQPRSGSLADVLDVILDKGIVIDAFVRVSLVGIEILTLDARIVVASVDTYMHFAREAHRLQLGGGEGSAKRGLGGMMAKLEEGGAHSITRGALRGAGEGLREGLLPGRKQPQERREGGIVQRAISSVKEKAVDSIRDALSPDDEEENNEQEGAGGSAQDSGPTAPAASPAPRRSRRRPPGDQGGQGAPGGGSPRRAAPSSRRAPPRNPDD